jgi:protein SCO1
MTCHVPRLALALVLAALLAGVSALQAQDFTVDGKLAKQGKSLFNGKGGCAACHSIGKGPQAGPDLLGVTDRRELDWIRRILTDTEEMLETDSIAMALLEEYKGVKMRIPSLRAPEVEALIHYLGQETKKQ